MSSARAGDTNINAFWACHTSVALKTTTLIFLAGAANSMKHHNYQWLRIPVSYPLCGLLHRFILKVIDTTESGLLWIVEFRHCTKNRLPL